MDAKGREPKKRDPTGAQPWKKRGENEKRRHCK